MSQKCYNLTKIIKIISAPKSKFSKPKSPLKGKLGYFGYIGKVKGKAPMKPPIFVDILMNDEEGTRIKVCIGGWKLEVGIKIGPKKRFSNKTAQNSGNPLKTLLD